MKLVLKFVRTICQNTQVLGDNNTPIAEIDWNISGGEITAEAFDKIEVLWGEANNIANITIKITLETDEIINKYICFDIIEGPQAQFEFASVPGQIHFCGGAEINMINSSNAGAGDEIVSYQWDFGDDTYSNEFEPAHAFDEPGLYTVSLTVVNDCNCSHTFQQDIEIAGPAFSIECPTVVCEDGTDVYFIDDIEEQCTSFHWSVEGGQILGPNNGSTVEVIWNEVDEDGFGYVNFDHSDCGTANCSSTVSTKVPVVQNNGMIKGDQDLCQNEQYKYSLPQWPTTDFQWKLINAQGQNFEENLVIVDQRNQIVVDTEELPTGTYQLLSNYQNTLLGCGGTAELTVKVSKQAGIEGPRTVCQQDEVLFEETSGSNSDIEWEIFYNGEPYPNSNQDNDQMVAVFEDPGFYSILASSPTLCPNDNFVVEVKQEPETPSGNILGPVKVCKEQPITYTYDQNISGAYFLEWNVTGGTVQGASSGQQVTVIFDEPDVSDFEVNASFVHKDLPDCGSEPLALNVIEDPIPNDVAIQNIDGATTFCPSSITSEFQLIDQSSSTPYELGEVYEWTIEPEEFATIESGNLTNTVTLNFNEVNLDDNGDPITQGELKLQVKRCGVYHTINAIPINKYNFDLSLDMSDVCRNEPFDVTVNSNVPIDPNASGPIELTVDNETLSDQPIFSNNDQTITFEDIDVTNENNDQTQDLSVNFSSPNGCNDISISESFDLLETPVVTIDPVGTMIYCDDEDIDLTIGALLLSGGGNSPEFNWYDEDDILISNQNTLNITEPAANNDTLDGKSYYVVVTNQDTGCSEISDTLTIIISDCDDDGTPDCQFPDADIDLVWQDCNTIEASAVNIPSNYTDLTWSISGPGDESISSGQGTTNAEFQVEEKGSFEIELHGTYPDCHLFLENTVEKGYRPAIGYNVSCNATGDGYEVALLNNSDYLEDYEPVDGDEVDFYLNGNPVPNDPNDINSSQTTVLPQGPGQEISIEVQDLNGSPVCTATRTIDVPAYPEADFSLASPQCYENEFLLSPDSPIDNNLDYTWSFMGTENLQTEHYISMPPSFDEEIELTVTGPFGCSDTSSVNIEVDQADFSEGDILGGGTFCNTLTTLQYNNQNETPSAYQWMRGSEAVQGATASSFEPTGSGSYWVQLFNGNGCVDESDPVNVTYIDPPEANVDAPLKACVDQDFTILAYTLPDGVEYQWDIGGNTTGWSTDLPARLDQYHTSTGVVDYSFQVRYINDPDCINEVDFQVEVIEPVEIDVTQSLIGCQPYAVKLTASGGVSGGLYNWSNSDTGGFTSPSVTVDHGGPYRLTYIPPDGSCETVVDLNVPKNPDEFIWIFPEGCFEFCSRPTDPYLIGPLPVFDGYQWLDEGEIINAGTATNIPDLMVESSEPSRELQLSLNNNNCTITSGPLHVTNLMNCSEDCENTEFNISQIEFSSQPFESYDLYGSITNNYNQTTTFTFTEVDGLGFFNPSSITLAPGQSFSFSPLTFIPNAGFNGGGINIGIEHTQQGDIICFNVHQIQLTEQDLNAKYNLVLDAVSPNPFTNDVHIDYQVSKNIRCNSLMLKLYDLHGREYIAERIDKAGSSKKLSTASLSPGKYILVLEKDGHIKDQKIIIKE